jgi:hypothetical protein
MSNVVFDLEVFLKDLKNTVLNPKSYFSGMKISGGIAEPIIKAAIYGSISGLIYLCCYLFKIKTLGAGYIGEAVGFLAFIKIIFSAVAGLLISAVIVLVISSICKGITDFEANLRVSASVLVVMPIYTLFSLSWAINIYLGLAISLIIFIYFLWLLYNGLVESLKCKKENVSIVCYVLTFLIILFLFLSVRTSGNQDYSKKVVKKNLKELKK